MNNAERIAALRHCADESREFCPPCPYFEWDKQKDQSGCVGEMMRDAADALEAADKRIAELEKQADHTDQVDAMNFATHLKQVARIAELEAQLPKEGEWIETEMGFDNYAWVCSACGEPWVLNAGTPSENNMSYCPNCGARMDGERKDGAV